MTIDIRPSRRAAWVACLVLGLVVVPALAGSSGKGTGIGGPPDERKRADDRFGVDPASLSDEDKEARLEIIKKEYNGLKRNQDILQTRRRRTHVQFVGEMRYPESADFLKDVFKNDSDQRTQVAALVAIGQCGDLEAIQWAVKKSISDSKKDPVHVLSLARMFARVENPEAQEWMATRMSHRDSIVLAAIVEAVGMAGVNSAMPKLEKLINDHQSIEVRFEALRAYGRCGGEDAISKLYVYLGDEDWRLRMAAAEGLGYTGDRTAIEEVSRLIIRGEEPIVIETATEAVARLGGSDAIDPLIECLKVGRLRARQKARRALTEIAKEEYRQIKDYHVDPNAWRSWWSKVQRGIDPDDPSVAGRETASYFEFPIHSDRVLFILDVSGSMDWPDAPKGSGIRPSAWKGRRIDVAHNEMFKALRDLAKQNQGRIPKNHKKGDTGSLPDAPTEEGVEPPTLFNVATFAGAIGQWQKRAVLADENNVELAIKWLKGQLPRGGTNTHGALEYGIAHENIDTVYFLSDGLPSAGKFDAHETILAEVRRMNRFKRISINTVALIIGKAPYESVLKYEDPGEMADFLSRIAEENQGEFSDASRP